MSYASPVILSFDKASFAFNDGKRVILNEASFSIRENTKITIMGQNGAGKSTIFKLIMGGELRRLHRLSRQLHIERLVDVLREGLIALEAREEDRLAVAEAGSRRAYERPAQALGAPPAKHRSVLREGLIAPEAREDRLAGAEAESRRAHERPAAALGAPPSKPRSPT